VNVLLDTNVLSEVRRPAPSAQVLAWLNGLDEDRAFISVASIAELRRGAALMENGRRRDALVDWIANDLSIRFAERVLPIDYDIAGRWGDLMAQSRRSGVALSVMDGFFAATALVHDLVLVTRNVRDFEAFEVKLFDPWA
jgi:predicted nucleic acid-binding protein